MNFLFVFFFFHQKISGHRIKTQACFIRDNLNNSCSILKPPSPPKLLSVFYIFFFPFLKEDINFTKLLYETTRENDCIIMKMITQTTKPRLNVKERVSERAIVEYISKVTNGK